MLPPPTAPRLSQEIGTPVYSNPEFGDYPVVGVTWDMASNYCKWDQGSLPTEAQWEKAARGSNAGVYPWGNDNVACDLLNYVGCLGHTSGVSDYPTGRSPYGLFDMAGNVFQWVNDFYDDHAYDNMPAQNPTGPASGDMHVVRGSSFETEAAQLMSGIRHPAASAYHSRDLGFRCVVNQQPKAIAPYCQTSSYIPTGSTAATGTCQVPDASVRGNYCAGKSGFTTVQISQDATFQVNTQGYNCTDSVVNGQRILTCTGPDKSSGAVTVCNAACSGAPTQTGASVSCDPGYTLDSSTGACIYSPVSAQPGIAGCPVGYNLARPRRSEGLRPRPQSKWTMPRRHLLRRSIRRLRLSSASPDAPYGIDNSALASQAFQGCAAGYNYDSKYQCCQASAGGAYPGCPVGSKFDTAQKTCVPTQVRLSGPGCVTVSLNVAKCSQPVDICSKITQEPVCLRNFYACSWSEKDQRCSMKKPILKRLAPVTSRAPIFLGTSVALTEVAASRSQHCGVQPCPLIVEERLTSRPTSALSYVVTASSRSLHLMPPSRRSLSPSLCLARRPAPSSAQMPPSRAPHTICSPIGRPPLLNPHGTEMAGRPVRLKGAVKRVSRLACSSASVPSISGAVIGVDGSSSASYCLKNSLIRCFISVWVRRASA